MKSCASLGIGHVGEETALHLIKKISVTFPITGKIAFISIPSISFPDGQNKKDGFQDRGGYDGPDDTLDNDLVLQVSQADVLDANLALEDHQAPQEAHQCIARPPGRRRRLFVFLDAFPREFLTAREEEEQETRATRPGQEEGEADDPERGGGETSPARGMVDRRRGERDQQHGQQAEDIEQNADHGHHAQRLERAVLDAQADEVAVRAVLEQVVDVIGNGTQGCRRLGFGDGSQRFSAHAGWQIEFLGRVGRDEQVGNGLQFFFIALRADRRVFGWLRGHGPDCPAPAGGFRVRPRNERLDILDDFCKPAVLSVRSSP